MAVSSKGKCCDGWCEGEGRIVGSGEGDDERIANRVWYINLWRDKQRQQRFVLTMYVPARHSHETTARSSGDGVGRKGNTGHHHVLLLGG